MSRNRFAAPTCLVAALLLTLAIPARALAAPVPRPDGAQSALADVMKKQPYLIYPGDPAQMEVLWQLTATATSTIEWGTDTGYGTGSALNDEYGADHQHAYTIGGLATSTRYYYRVTTSGYAYTGSFTSAPDAGAQQLKFLAYGDTRTNPATHNQVAAAMISAFTADPAYQTFTLFMGDFVNTGNSETYWTNEFFSPTYASIRSALANLPYQACMGNHENSSPVLFTKYFPYPWVAGRYWSFDYGPVHVTVLDQYTSYTSGSAQLQWIANDLATTTKTWKIVLLHEPGWSSGNGHANNTSTQTLIQPLCVQYGVSIVFAGHNHNYCRAVVNGVMHLTTGGGGAPLDAPLAGQPNVVASAMLNHFCKIAIDGGVLRLQALNSANGALIDSFTMVRTVADNTPPAVSVTSPDGGEDWRAGASHSITWSATDNVGVTSVDLAYSTNGGATFPNAIASGLANIGSYPWTVPSTPGTAARVRVRARDAAGNLGADSSAANFTIDLWNIEASAGAGGSIVPVGQVPVVQGASQRFSIAPSPNYHLATLTVDGIGLAPDTTYTFSNVSADHSIAAAFSGDACEVTVSVVGGGTVTKNPDQASYPYGTGVQLTAAPDSNWAFSDWSGDTTASANPLELVVTRARTLTATFVDAAAPVVHVTSPVGGEVWNEGSAQTITWTAGDNVGVDSVNVDCSFSGVAGPWQPVAHGLTNSGSLPWTVPGQPTDSALMRVTAYDHALNAGSARSDSLFRIAGPTAGVGAGGPVMLALARPQPNPGQGTTLLRFSLPRAGRARLEILDLSGRRLWRAESELGAGPHECRWDGRGEQGGSVGAGLYFVRLVTPWGNRTERLVWLR